jgi:hypothetical protein
MRLAVGQPPTVQQAEAANVWARLRALAIPLYITAQTEHILQRRLPVFATSLLMHTRTLQKGRYLRRWARRLRDVSFSPEDAIVLAYGSFGLDLQAQRVGVEAIVTNDQKLAPNFTARFAAIEEHFTNMVGQLLAPYHELSLPTVVTTAEILAED